MISLIAADFSTLSDEITSSLAAISVMAFWDEELLLAAFYLATIFSSRQRMRIYYIRITWSRHWRWYRMQGHKPVKPHCFGRVIILLAFQLLLLAYWLTKTYIPLVSNTSRAGRKCRDASTSPSAYQHCRMRAEYQSYRRHYSTRPTILRIAFIIIYFASRWRADDGSHELFGHALIVASSSSRGSLIVILLKRHDIDERAQLYFPPMFFIIAAYISEVITTTVIYSAPFHYFTLNTKHFLDIITG